MPPSSPPPRPFHLRSPLDHLIGLALPLALLWFVLWQERLASLPSSPPLGLETLGFLLPPLLFLLDLALLLAPSASAKDRLFVSAWGRRWASLARLLHLLLLPTLVFSFLRGFLSLFCLQIALLLAASFLALRQPRLLLATSGLWLLGWPVQAVAYPALRRLWQDEPRLLGLQDAVGRFFFFPLPPSAPSISEILAAIQTSTSAFHSDLQCTDPRLSQEAVSEEQILRLPSPPRFSIRPSSPLLRLLQGSLAFGWLALWAQAWSLAGWIGVGGLFGGSLLLVLGLLCAFSFPSWLDIWPPRRSLFSLWARDRAFGFYLGLALPAALCVIALSLGQILSLWASRSFADPSLRLAFLGLLLALQTLRDPSSCLSWIAFSKDDLFLRRLGWIEVRPRADLRSLSFTDGLLRLDFKDGSPLDLPFSSSKEAELRAFLSSLDPESP